MAALAKNAFPAETIVIRPEVFIKILLHIHRFWNADQAYQDQKRVAGFVLGRVDGNELLITDAEPVCHDEGGSLPEVFEEVFFQHAQDYNQSNAQAELPDRVRGFYSSHFEQGLKFTAADIRNLIPFLNDDPACFGLIVDVHHIDKIDCFKCFTLDPGVGGFFSAMSEYKEIPWRMETFKDMDKLLSIFKNLIRNVTSHGPLITEIDEY